MKKLLLFSLIAISSLSYAQTSSVELKDGMGGLLSLHNSVASAYAAIPGTIAQQYIIEVTATYTGANETAPITFSGKTGTSSANTITLRPATGVSQVTISGNLNGKILVLDNVNYHIIDGRAGGVGPGQNLKIQNLSTTTSSYTVELINGASFNTLEHLHMYQAGGASAGPRVVHIATSASNPSGNSNNTIQFCKIQGSRSGIYSGGTAANKNTNNTIYGCEIYDWTFAGVWLQSNTGTITIDSCTMYETVVSATTPTGILGGAFDNGIFTRNNIYGLKYTSTIKGITVTGASTAYLANNMISLTDANTSSTTVVGIEFSGTSLQNATVVNNTLRIGGTLASGGTSGSVASAGFSKTNSNVSSVFTAQNNIVVNERTGGNAGVQHVASAVTSTVGTIVADYNTYNSSSGTLTRFSTFTFSSMAQYQLVVTPQEANSNDAPVQFVSATDLHLAGTSLGNFSLEAMPQPSVLVDIDNEARGTTPYRGADESISNPLPVELLYFTANKKEEDVLLQWNIAGGEANRVELERSFDGVSYTGISSVSLTEEQDEYAYTDQNVLTSKNRTLFYRLKMTAPGEAHYSRTLILKNSASTPMSLSVYPNPVASHVTVMVDAVADDEAYMELTDQMGRIVAAHNYTMQKGINTFHLDMATYPVGIYLLRLRVANEYVRTKLQKL